MDTVEHLEVYRIALTTINVPHDDGATALFPVAGIWADLSPLREAGMRVQGAEEDQSLAVLMISGCSLDAENPAVMNVVVSRAEEADEDGSPILLAGPSWVLRMPTSWVAMASVALLSPWQFRLMLLDGPPPAAPEIHVLTLDTAGVLLIPDHAAVSPTLAGVMNPEWAPQIEDDEGEDEEPVEPMRDRLFAVTAGVALGQEFAWNSAGALAGEVAELAAVCAAAGADPDDGEAAVEVPAEVVDLYVFLTAADRLAAAQHAGDFPGASNGKTGWQSPMASLGDRIDSTVPAAAIAAYAEAATYTEVAGRFGHEAAVLALVASAAARSTSAAREGVDGEGAGRYTPAYLLGVWLDEETTTPWWATRATGPLLMAHDTAVLVNLLACNLGDYPQSALATRFLHVIVEALAGMEMCHEHVVEALHELDVTPVNLDDMAYVVKVLLTAFEESADDPDDPLCPGCSAVDALVAVIEDQQRLVRVMAGLLAVLADLDADLTGLAVGDDAWIEHRQDWLGHWLGHTAVRPAA